MFLAIRMLVYIAAVPFAAWLGGSYDPVSHVITIDLDNAMQVIGAAAIAGGTFLTSRFAKARGGKT